MGSVLHVPQLDDLSYQEIFERARGKIASATQEWTDYNYHDPGITTLSTFAWLTDTLNYYLNAVGEPHRLKYLKLLGIRPVCQVAQCVISLEAQGEHCLTRGAQVWAEGVPFEIIQTAQGETVNQLVYLYHEVDGKKWDITEFAGVDGQYATIFSLDKKAETAVYFGFAQPLSGQFSIYIETDSPSGRNAFDGAFALASLAFEYCDGTQWLPVQIVQDETHQFLSSGLLTLCIAQDASTSFAQGDGLLPAHYLRCRLLKNEYDFLPRLGKISTNCTFAKQMLSYARALPLQHQGAQNICVDWCVQPDDHLALWVKEGEQFVQWYESGEQYRNRCEMQQGAYPWQRVIHFGTTEFLETPSANSELLWVATKSEAFDAAQLGRTLGVANETLSLDAENVYELTLALIDDAHEYAQMQLWEYTDDLCAAAYDAAVFTIDPETRTVQFGDGIHGMQVPAKRRVVAVTLSTSRFEGGNVLAGSVNQLRSAAQGVQSLSNLADAQGGVRQVDSHTLEAKIEEKLARVTRAVTEDDYRQLVKQTPGLMIDSVQVVPMQVYAQYCKQEETHNTVVVVVKPTATEPCPVLSENYRQMICAHLEKYRLLTTNFRVESARYVCVSAAGRVYLRDASEQAQVEIKEKINRFLDGSSKGAFGQPVRLSKLFAEIERLDSVVKVAQLSLEQVGAGGQKNQHGDIMLAPDVLAYPGNITVEFLLR